MRESRHGRVTSFNRMCANAFMGNRLSVPRAPVRGSPTGEVGYRRRSDLHIVELRPLKPAEADVPFSGAADHVADDYPMYQVDLVVVASFVRVSISR